MTFQLIFQVAVFVSVMVDQCESLTFNCVSSKPQDQETLSCTCTNPLKNGVEWRKGAGLTTTCGGGTNNDCFPAVTGYTSDVSKDEFYLQINPYTYTDCAIYSCKDSTTGDEAPITTSIADFDASSVTFLEPGANTDGQITVTTGCVFPPGDVKVTWYKIKDNNEEDFTKERPSSVDSSDRSSCTDTCNTDESKKVTSGFTHTQYKGSNFDEVQYKAVVTHSSYTDAADKFTWTSAKYRLEKGCPKHCKDRVIASIVFCICGIILLAVVIIGIVKNGLRWTVILVVGIISIVLFIISLALSWSVLADDRCKDCKVWLTIAKVCVGISCGGAVADIVILILVRCGVINVPGGNAYKAKEAKHPDENDRMAETSN